MIELFIDESGSLTKEFAYDNPFFLMCVIKINDLKKAKEKYRKFINDNYEDLKASDHYDRMFCKGKFVELKGSALNLELKEKFLQVMLQGEYIDIFYIIVENDLTKKRMLENCARMFNYLLENLLKDNLKNGNLPNDRYYIHIDNRNLELKSTNSLEDHLAIELRMKENLLQNVDIEYYDSKTNIYIQIADFFSNLYFSYLNNVDKYHNLIEILHNSNSLKSVLWYPFKEE